MNTGRGNDVLVIGAHGVLGILTVRAFRAAGWNVTAAARRRQPGLVWIDLDSRESVAAAIRDHPLVVNTVPHPGLLAERLVLERGGALISTSGLPAAGARSLRAEAGGARGTVLMNAGIAPGVTNLVAADLLRRHPDTDELEIVFTISGAASRGRAGGDFVHRGLTAVPEHRTEVVPLPAPFGERRCVGFGEGEGAWLGGLTEGRVVRLYLCVAEEDAHNRMLALNRAGSMSALPRSLLRSRELPVNGAASDEPVAHWIAARHRGRRIDARTVECRGDFVHAAKSTVVFAEMLLSHDQPGGCCDPEELCTLGELEPRLAAAGVRVVPQPARD